MEAKKNILITGVTGYVGSNLVKAIHKNYNLFGIVRHTSDTTQIKDYCNLVLIEDLEKCFQNNKIDIVIHLATNYQKQSDYIEYFNMINDNIVFGVKLLSLMEKYNVKNFINIETIFQHATGTSDYVPVNFYASTKEAFTKILDFMHIGKNFNITSLVLYDTYGPNDNRKKIFNILKQAIQKGEREFNMTPSEQIVNFLHINEAVNAINVAMERSLTTIKSENNRFFIPGESRSLKDAVLIFLSLSSNSLQVNFGAIEYPKEIVMKPFIGIILPNWYPQISLEKGLLCFFENDANN